MTVSFRGLLAKIVSPAALIGLLLCSPLALTGCGKGNSTTDGANKDAAKDGAKKHAHKHDHDHDHDHDEGKKEAPHFDTLEQAVAKAESLRVEIKGLFEKNELKNADNLVHDLAGVLEEIPKLAKTSTLNDAQKAEVTKEYEIVSDNFMVIDEKLHNPAKGKTYAEVADKIEPAMKKLLELAPAAKPAPKK